MSYGWFWRFEDGVLAQRTVPTAQESGEPPEGLLAYPSPLLADAWGGWMPAADTPRSRARLLEEFSPAEVHVYRRTVMSQISDEDYGRMTHVARGASYAFVGTLLEVELDTARERHADNPGEGIDHA